jgi:hypothetical protein
MADQHPLTDEIMERIAINAHWSGDTGDVVFRWDDMRAAADWQLDQDQKNLEDFLEEFSYRGHGAEAILELRSFVNNFKSYMRPQEDNS